MIAIRGAITLECDTREEMFSKSKELTESILAMNSIASDDIVSIITSTTADLKSAYPGSGIRAAGVDVPILCMQEQCVLNSLKMCLRFLVHVNKDIKPIHVYLKEAKSLLETRG